MILLVDIRGMATSRGLILHSSSAIDKSAPKKWELPG